MRRFNTFTRSWTGSKMVNANNMWIGIEKDGYAHS